MNSIGKASCSDSQSNSTELLTPMHGNLHRKELRTCTKLSGLNPPISTLSSLPENSLLRVTRSNATVKLVDSGSSSNEDDGGDGVYRHSSSSGGGDGVLVTSRDGGGLNGNAMLNGSVRKMETLTDSYGSLRPSIGVVNCKRGDPDTNVRRMGSPVSSGLKEDQSHILRNRTAPSLRLRPYNINQRGSGSSNKAS